jgi:hypothetical protein
MVVSDMTQAIQTEIYKAQPARFDMAGQRLADFLDLTSEQISPGLAQRLARYALNRLDDAGFKAAVEGWACLVCSDDAEDIPSKRSYYVRWKNPKGGFIEVTYILTRNGWPHIDHGISAGIERY